MRAGSLLLVGGVVAAGGEANEARVSRLGRRQAQPPCQASSAKRWDAVRGTRGARESAGVRPASWDRRRTGAPRGRCVCERTASPQAGRLRRGPQTWMHVHAQSRPEMQAHPKFMESSGSMSRSCAMSSVLLATAALSAHVGDAVLDVDSMLSRQRWCAARLSGVSVAARL